MFYAMNGGEPTHPDTRLAPNGTTVGETRTLEKKKVRGSEAREGIVSIPHNASIP